MSKGNRNNSFSESYLLLPRQWNAVSITGLSVEALKASAKEVVRSRDEKAKHLTILNAIAKGLGFSGGFAGLKKELPKVHEFLQANGMHKRADLVRYRSDWGWSLHRRDVADRLFHSGLPLPEKLFTGYDFDWLRVRQHLRFISDAEFDQRLSELGWLIGGRDLFVAGRSQDLRFGLNYLSDFLVDPRSRSGVVGELYFTDAVDEKSRAIELQRIEVVCDIFRDLIDLTADGWVDVIPYSEKLVFLKGHDGEYDLLFPNLRDEAPPEYVYADALDPNDVPSTTKGDDLFPNVEYYELDRWFARDHHEAELAFYAQGGTAVDYPGMAGVRRLNREEGYEYRINERPGGPLDGFKRVAIVASKELFVQESPVTIGAFKRFMSESGYESRRKTDQDNPWRPANLDADDQPATGTYYDALAYAAWFEKEYKRPVRLLTIEEYRAIHPGPRPVPGEEVFKQVSCSADDTPIEWLQVGCVEFRHEDGTVVDAWRWFSWEDEWPQLQAWFKPNLALRTGKKGIRFFTGYNFGEWLFEHQGTEAAAIKTSDLTSFHYKGVSEVTSVVTGATTESDLMSLCYGDSVEREFHPMRSWGKYKASKIGFRLCYLASTSASTDGEQ